MSRFVLKLFIADQTPRSMRALTNLRRICAQHLANEYELVVIDILEQPQLAEDEQILATPTLVKEFPPPIRRLIGDLSNTEKILTGLDLQNLSE